MGWLAMKSLLDSIEAAGSTDSGKIVEALEGWSQKRGDITARYRPFDHQMTNRLLVAGIHEKITDKWDYFNVRAELPSTSGEIDAAFGIKEEIGCKMGAL